MTKDVLRDGNRGIGWGGERLPPLLTKGQKDYKNDEFVRNFKLESENGHFLDVYLPLEIKLSQLAVLDYELSGRGAFHAYHNGKQSQSKFCNICNDKALIMIFGQFGPK